MKRTIDELAGRNPKSMSISAETITAPTRIDRPASDDVPEPDPPWVVIVWNDPVNLMSYVTWVCRSSSATRAPRPRS